MLINNYPLLNWVIIIIYYLCIIMDLITHGLPFTLGVFKAFFFFFSAPIPEDTWDDWIAKDGFRSKPHLKKSKAYLFDELNLAKKNFLNFLDSNESMAREVGALTGARIINQYTNAHVIRIKKIRLMIEFKIYINTNINPSGIKYVLAKSCWISNKNGKVIKKFTKLMGQEDEVKVRGKIPASLMDNIEIELEKAMWNEYCLEYSTNPNFK